jgi:putative Ca2+/H+ antiporter (TMEM165/GDT1 family)
MSALAAAYQRSAIFRALARAALLPLWAALFFVASNTLSGYSQIGDALGVIAIVAFAAWAWWWSEQRDRHAEAQHADDGP